MQAFSDTTIFSYLDNPNSLKTKFLLSPFIANFPTGITLKKSTGGPQRVKRYTTRTKTQIRFLKELHLESSIVETFFSRILDIELAKQDVDENGLDPDCDWISINAIILLGIVNCDGSDADKGEVFYRVVQPAMLPRIFITNQDIRMALFFITNLATILLYMRAKVSRDGSENPRAFDIEFFKKKMASYEVVFEAVLA